MRSAYKLLVILVSLFLVGTILVACSKSESSITTQNKISVDVCADKSPITNEDVSKLSELAEQGKMEAQFKLGLLYACGCRGIRKDDATAEKWFLLAANQDSAKYQYALAALHGRGPAKHTALKRRFCGQIKQPNKGMHELNYKTAEVILKVLVLHKIEMKH